MQDAVRGFIALAAQVGLDFDFLLSPFELRMWLDGMTTTLVLVALTIPLSLAGGVGLAAVEYAHWLRVDVTGTAGRPQKHRPLWLQRVGRLCSSRDAAAFSCGAATAHCGGRLQLVLNSLSADFVPVSAASRSARRCPPAAPPRAQCAPCACRLRPP